MEKATQQLQLERNDGWQTLERFLGMNNAEASTLLWRGNDQGAQLKSTLGWDNDREGNNSSGFNAFPAGFYIIHLVQMQLSGHLQNIVRLKLMPET